MSEEDKAEQDAGMIATALRASMTRSWDRGHMGSWLFVVGYGLLSLVAMFLGAPWWAVVMLIVVCSVVYGILERKTRLHYEALELGLLKETYKNLLEQK